MRGEYGKAADQLGLARTDLCLAQIILNWAFCNLLTLVASSWLSAVMSSFYTFRRDG